LATESLTIDGVTYTIQRSYDTAGRLVQLTYPDGSIVTRSYTARNLLQQVDYDADGAGPDPAPSVASFVYDAGGRATSRTHGNGIVTGRTYNRQDNLVTSIDVPGCPGLSFSYSYDENKNVTAETTGGVMAGYSFTAGYDNEDRLIGWQRQNGDRQSWTLTLVGDWQQFVENGTTQNRTHGPTHELTAIDSTGLSYDPKGNLTQDHEGKTYVWDFDNHLASVTVPAGASGIEGTHTYRYDALGRRVSKTVNEAQAGTSETTVFVCTTHPLPFSPYAGQVLAEYHSGAAVTDPERKYAYGTYIDEPLLLLSALGSGLSAFYYHQNCLYTVTALTDSTGTAVERYAYTPYGEMSFLEVSGNLLSNQRSVLSHSYTFTGRRLDSESRTYYCRARHYASSTGRFSTRDKIQKAMGPTFVLSRVFVIAPPAESLYEYVGSGPTNATDPSGLIKITIGSTTYDLKTCKWKISLGYEEDACPYSDAKQACSNYLNIFDAIKKEYGDPFAGLPPCPCNVEDAERDPECWGRPVPPRCCHPKATKCTRSVKSYPVKRGKYFSDKCAPGQQCCYDASGKLITHGPSAGTPDLASPKYGCINLHNALDVCSWACCKKAGMLDEYLKRWKPNNANNCPPNNPDEKEPVGKTSE